MSQAHQRSRVERLRIRRLGAVAALGLATAVASIIWLPNLALYLIGLALAALAGARLVRLLLEEPVRLWGAGAIALSVVVAILTPWQLASAERSGSPHWTLEAEGIVGNLDVHGDRLLFSDDNGLHAVDVTSGRMLWSFDDLDRVDRLKVAADGHVLVLTNDIQGNEALWLSPGGKALWRSEAGSDLRYLMGVNLRAARASSDGVLVAPRCANKPDDDNPACTYVGIGPDGTMRWEVDGYSGTLPDLSLYEIDSGPDDPVTLPEVAVVDSLRDEGGKALVVTADDGSTVADIDVDKTVAIAGKTVVYESGPADTDGKCRSHGISVDGNVDWSAETPCLEGHATMLGKRIYGAIENDQGTAVGERPIEKSFMIDATTGRWKMVGALAYFNLRVDATTGEPGPDIVVQRHHQHLTARDPDSGDKLWEMTTAGDGIPGVSGASGTTVVLATTDRGHNPFYAGDDRRNATTVLVVDSDTGKVTGKRILRSIWSSIPAGPGRAVLVDHDGLSLIGTAPD